MDARPFAAVRKAALALHNHRRAQCQLISSPGYGRDGFGGKIPSPQEGQCTRFKSLSKIASKSDEIGFVQRQRLPGRRMPTSDLLEVTEKF